jgi:hypothetical protein
LNPVPDFFEEELLVAEEVFFLAVELFLEEDAD